MIPRTAPAWQTINWQKSLAEAIRDPAELLQRLDLPQSLLPAARQAARLFPLRVPRSYLARMKKADLNDPLLRQVLPLQAELDPQPLEYSEDPVGDLQAMPVPGLLHKYQGRVLLVTTGACGIHCRYCFRRHYPYPEAQARPGEWEAALRYIRDDQSIEEVILSGGDPLSLSNDRLALLLSELAGIAHIKRLRIHTRQPVVLPERIDEGLLALLAGSPLQMIMVIHCNHAQEIDGQVEAQLARVAASGCTLLNQAVLLKGVNDDLAALKQLSETLFQVGVIPYYLHQLDKVRGGAHFAVSKARALQLEQAMRDSLPGYLVPKLVQEQAGEAAKTPLQKT
ncbi:MAG: EF-P beta-lysylation protein EpmB [Thioalkalispiraceae bacterium]|jgi:EF-P beta-lysylation protein EpmB